MSYVDTSDQSISFVWPLSVAFALLQSPSMARKTPYIVEVRDLAIFWADNIAYHKCLFQF